MEQRGSYYDMPDCTGKPKFHHSGKWEVGPVLFEQHHDCGTIEMNCPKFHLV